jgi:hypothetical protein
VGTQTLQILYRLRGDMRFFLSGLLNSKIK